MAIMKDGVLMTWGWGKYGQLGHGNSRDSSRPLQVSALLEVDVEFVAVGEVSVI